MNFPIFIIVTMRYSDYAVSAKRRINAVYIRQMWTVNAKDEAFTQIDFGDYVLKVKETPEEITRMITNEARTFIQASEITKKCAGNTYVTY